MAFKDELKKHYESALTGIPNSLNSESMVSRDLKVCLNQMMRFEVDQNGKILKVKFLKENPRDLKFGQESLKLEMIFKVLNEFNMMTNENKGFHI